MGISQIGITTATASPASASRPVFTLANTYDLSASITTFETQTGATDAVYDRANQKICFPVTSTTTVSALASWTPGTTSVSFYNLPVSLQTDTYKFIYGYDNAIWYSPGLEGGNYSVYRSTNGGSTWTTPIGTSTKYELIPLSSANLAIINPTDTVPVMYFDGIGMTSPSVYNTTTSTIYTGSTSNTGTQIGTNTKFRMAPITKGDDTGIISGYHTRISTTHSSSSGTSSGSVHFSLIKPYHNRAAGGYLLLNKPLRIVNNSYETWAEVGLSGKTTCIEGRWFYTIGEQGNELYDLHNGMIIGDIPQLNSYYNGRLIYLSDTKKGYIYNKYTKKMYEYDVTFI